MFFEPLNERAHTMILERINTYYPIRYTVFFLVLAGLCLSLMQFNLFNM